MDPRQLISASFVFETLPMQNSPYTLVDHSSHVLLDLRLLFLSDSTIGFVNLSTDLLLATEWPALNSSQDLEAHSITTNKKKKKKKKEATRR
jgi:hypothetical protein